MIQTVMYTGNDDDLSYKRYLTNNNTSNNSSIYSSNSIHNASMTSNSNKTHNNNNNNSISNGSNGKSLSHNGNSNEISVSSNEVVVRTQFEKLIDNLKNNPEYKKEMYLNKLIGFYRIGSEIGTGNFSQVKLGLHLLTREKVAIKILNKTKLDEKTQRLLLREISSMQKLHHPNIIRLYEVIHTQERLYICMEYAPEGELYTKISSDGKLSEEQSRHVFSQIISAIDHMHSKNIIHRDIKAENIFFSNLNPLIIKVGDLGFSTEAAIERQLNTYCGSPPYAAPELFRDDSYVGIYVDIWALGVLLYFIVTGIMPFKAETVSKLKRIILNGDYVIPSFVSESCQLLIKGILKPVPKDRFTIKEIMESAWLDHEKIIQQLEPYQFNPTMDKKDLKLEEVYTLTCMEKLGISKTHLILSNLYDPHVNGNGMYYGTGTYSNHYTNSSNTNNMNNQQYQSTLMDLLIKSKSVQAELIERLKSHRSMQMTMSTELKQQINGTYRIIFHSIQKIMRNEANSEESHDSFIKTQYATFRELNQQRPVNNQQSFVRPTIYTNNGNKFKTSSSTSSHLDADYTDSSINSTDTSTSQSNHDALVSNNIKNFYSERPNQAPDKGRYHNRLDSPNEQNSNSNSAPVNGVKSIFVKENLKNDNKNVDSKSLFIKYNANNKLPNSAGANHNTQSDSNHHAHVYNRSVSHKEQSSGNYATNVNNTKTITRSNTAQTAMNKTPQSANSNGKQQYQSKLCTIL